MKLTKLAMSGLVIACALTGSKAEANQWPQPAEINIRQAMQRLAPDQDAFNSQRSMKIDELNKKMSQKTGKRFKYAEAEENEFTPDVTFGDVRSFYDLLGPDGSTWYCTTELYSTEIENQYYIDYILQEYIFNIYDADFNYVGSIHDKMRYEPDEVRVPGPDQGIALLPVVTKNYFNNDDKYEVVVALAVNSTTAGVNHYRSVIYSIGGRKETVTITRDNEDVNVVVDCPIGQIDGFVCDVLNASTSTEENFYMTLMGEDTSFPDLDWDKLMDGDMDEGQKYWDAMSTNGYVFLTYGKADASGQLVKVFEKKIPYQMNQGDQESTAPIVTFMHNGKPYILAPYYKDTFYNPFYSPIEDMSMREGNYLVLDLYELTATDSSIIHHTEIPMEKVEGEGILCSYYAVGDLRYDRDVEFDENDVPTYLVTRCNYTTASDDTSGYCFYKYNVDGERVLTIYEDSEAQLMLTDVPGYPAQGAFVNYDDEVGYVFSFVNLNEGVTEKTVRINYLLDTGYDEPEVLSYNLDRVPLGDTYKYAFEMRAPLTDENDNDFLRVAWFNADGSFDRIDHVAMGTSVMYAKAYIKGDVLNPTLICSDDANEYLVLVKRGLSSISSESQEELLVAQPTDADLEGGRNLLHLVPCDKGALRSISIYRDDADRDPMLYVFYMADDEHHTADFYYLPLDAEHSGVDSAEVAPAPGIAYSAGVLTSAGNEIKVFNAQGALVAKGFETLSTADLEKGVYVAVAGESRGKFLVK